MSKLLVIWCRTQESYGTMEGKVMGVGEAFTGYTFRPDDASIPNSLRYGSVSHTALNLPYLRKSLTNGHCLSGQAWNISTLLYRLTSIRYLKLLLWSSWRNFVNMERPKLLSLVGLVFQSSLLALTTRYSRVEQVEGDRYITSTAVVMSEVIKVVICILIMAVTARKTLLSQLATLTTGTRDVMKCCVPALLYTIQNNLQFVAMTYLDAATFQVTYQLKILTTALFSVCFLRRQLDIVHWTALILLTGGVAMVQFPGAIDCSTNSDGSCAVSEGHIRDMLVGVASVLAMCVSSGFAGVYTEKILKATNTAETLWGRNLQLAVTSVVVGMAYVYFYDGKAVMTSGFLQGYDTITWIVVFQQAILGLVISLVMKYADNILKGFASSIAIVITTIVSLLILHDLQLSCSFLVGAVVVMGSALLYNVDRNVDFRNPESVI